jgi:hypothetical protein
VKRKSRLQMWREDVVDRWFGDVVAERVDLAVKVIDDEYWTKIYGGDQPSLDRDWMAHKEDLEDVLTAYRTNPLARRIVTLTTDYVVGSGIFAGSSVPWVEKFVDEFWRLNNMEMRCYQWCDELTRSGELFIVMRTDEVSGASFVRALPAVRIDRIRTHEHDLERELEYHEVTHGDFEGRWWPAGSVENLGDEQVMLHYAINRPVGCVRGDGDLGPILPWLRRYKDWLENRVRLNKYKTAFMWDVTITGRPGRGDTVRKKRFKYKTAPDPGSIVVHDDGEKWEAVSPKLEAWDAKEDGKALRLMIGAGAGIPLHFLAEGETATRATAREMGDPTYRHYGRRQLYFGYILKDLLTWAVKRANVRGRGKAYAELGLYAKFPDVRQDDNREIAESAQMIVRALDTLARWGWIDKQSAIELAMKFAGELIDVEAVFARLESEGPAPVPDAVLAGSGGGWGGSAPSAGRPIGSTEGTGEGGG